MLNFSFMYNIYFGGYSMKSSIRKTTYQAIYRLLDRVSPVNYDCGELCNCACCTGDTTESGDEMGIYLLPGEEKLFTKDEDWLSFSTDDAANYDFPDSWFGKVYFVSCKNAPNCPRNSRPLQCRFFPILPHFTLDGDLVLILNDVELPYSCPLIQDSMNLTENFLKANHTVWKHLIKDPLIFDLVEWDSEVREVVNIVYP